MRRRDRAQRFAQRLKRDGIDRATVTVTGARHYDRPTPLPERRVEDGSEYTIRILPHGDGPVYEETIRQSPNGDPAHHAAAERVDEIRAYLNGSDVETPAPRYLQ